MKWLKKIAAVVLVVLAGLGVLICAAGIIGTLAVNAPLSNAAAGTIETVQGYFTSINQTTQRIHTRISALRSEVDEIQERLSDAEISDAAVLEFIVAQIDTSEMRPNIENLLITAGTIYDSLQAFNLGLEALNRIPGIDIPTLSDELTAVTARLEAVEAHFEEIQAGLNSSENIKNRLLQPVNRLSVSLGEVETALAEEESKFTAVEASLGSLRLTVLRLIDLASMALVLLFVVLGAGQVLLIEKAWKWFRSISLSSSQVHLQAFGLSPTGGDDEEISTGSTN